VKVLFIISTDDDAETMYNALRMANVGLQKGVVEIVNGKW
jgi:hypothetical protein